MFVDDALRVDFALNALEMRQTLIGALTLTNHLDLVAMSFVCAVTLTAYGICSSLQNQRPSICCESENYFSFICKFSREQPCEPRFERI